jgi:hypothetical protein
MLSLNILPEKNKKELKINFIFEKIINIFYLATFLFLAASILLMLSNLTLGFNISNAKNNNMGYDKKNEDVYTQIDDLNKKLEIVDGMQKNHIEWTKIIDFLMENNNSDITFSYMSISKETEAKLNLKGFAKTRDSLLTLKKAMENSLIFEKIDFPLQNILEKNDISFIINANIKLNEINK